MDNSQQVVADKLAGVAPKRLRKWVVEIGTTTYPVRQAYSIARGSDQTEFNSHQARNWFKRLGFRVSCLTTF